MSKPLTVSTTSKTPTILWLAIAGYVVLFSLVCIWKYSILGYNAMDLAIYNQVFFHSSLGNWFGSTIHPPSYLGDHFEPILLFLLPFYFLFRHPVTLLVLQSVVLGLAAWPLYRIARLQLSQRLSLLVGLAWLFNPFVQNINLFEFHLLAFAPLVLLFAILHYQQRSFWPFCLTVGLALLVREDAALVVAAFGILALLERRAWRWVATPIIAAASYFIFATSLISRFTGGYKFSIYYAWLGNTPLEGLANLFLKPWLAISHIVTLGNAEFALGLLLPFIFVPLLAPRYLWLAAVPFIQLVLGSAGGSGTLLLLHYSALLLPGVAVAAINGLDRFSRGQFNQRAILLAVLRRERPLASMIAAVTIGYTMLVLGPLPAAVSAMANPFVRQSAAVKWEVLNKIPANASVAASYETLAPLSSRANLASLNYVFLGKQQFLSRDYSLPPSTEYLVLDSNDLITYRLQYGTNPFFQAQYGQAITDWPKVLEGFGLVSSADSLAVYQRGASASAVVVEQFDRTPALGQEINQSIDGNLQLLGTRIDPTGGYQFFWLANQPLAREYQLRIRLNQNKKPVYETIRPLAYGLLPADQWPVGKTISTNYSFDFKNNVPVGTYQLELTVIEIQNGGVEVNGLRSTVNVIDEVEEIGEPVELGIITI